MPELLASGLNVGARAGAEARIDKRLEPDTLFLQHLSYQLTTLMEDDNFFWNNLIRYITKN